MKYSDPRLNFITSFLHYSSIKYRWRELAAICFIEMNIMYKLLETPTIEN